MSLKLQRILNAFAVGIRPQKKMDIKEFAKNNVKLSRSDRSNYADLDLTPHLTTPLQTIIDNDYNEVVMMYPTGAGKSTAFEILACYIAIEKPAPTLMIAQTELAASKWMELGITPTLKNCDRLKDIWPKDYHRKVRKDSIIFPHFPLYVLGPAKSNLQGLSVQFLIIDEAWMLPEGHIAFAKKRTHDRAFRSIVLAGQAGTTSCEFTQHWETSKKHEWMYLCPTCKQHHPYVWENMKWDNTLKISEMVAEYHCPCGHIFKDTPEDRRFLSESSSFQCVQTDKDDPTDGRIGYRMNAMGVLWIEFKTLLMEFIEANNAKKKGDLTLLEKFKTQRLCQPWTPDDEITIIPVRKSGYSLADRLQYQTTTLTVDVQGSEGDDNFWYLVRTWTSDGRSRLLDCGRFSDINQIKLKQDEWQIAANCVGIDSGYKTDIVQNYAAEHGYITLNGQQQPSFTVTKNGKTFQRIYAKIKDVRTTSGKYCKYISFASNRSKTILAALRSAESNTWEVPHDIPEFYTRHLNAEKLDNGLWKAINKRDNHLLDCESMSLILAIVHKNYLTQEES